MVLHASIQHYSLQKIPVLCLPVLFAQSQTAGVVRLD